MRSIPRATYKNLQEEKKKIKKKINRDVLIKNSKVRKFKISFKTGISTLYLLGTRNLCWKQVIKKTKSKKTK